MVGQRLVDEGEARARRVGPVPVQYFVQVREAGRARVPRHARVVAHSLVRRLLIVWRLLAQRGANLKNFRFF